MKQSILTFAFTLVCSLLMAQTKPKLAVISFDALGAQLDKAQLTELLRIEISKHAKYEMIDRYEISEMLQKAEIDNTSCFSKTCLKEAGKILNVDYVMSGSADILGDALFIRLRMIDLAGNTIKKEVVREFLNIPEKANTMISICVNELLDLPNDELIVKSLSNRDSYESAVNNPYYQTLSLAGPRMGYTFFTGDMATTIRAPKSEGGYDGYPAFFQMGYQFEKQYLNEGKWQALFEFIPMVSGLDQGLFVPSFTIMNGIRNNKNGLEFAIGPSVNLSREMTAYDIDNQWIRKDDIGFFNSPNNLEELENKQVIDSRGTIKLKSYVVLAAGYSLKSGKLNIPINIFVVPSKDNVRYGFSFGFNVRK
jgi:TolB-like protein